MIALALALALGVAPGRWKPSVPATSEIDLPRFRIYATAKALGTAKLLAARLEADRDLVAHQLGRDYPGITEVRVGEGPEELAALDLPGDAAPRWAAGLAHPEAALILLDARALRRDGGIGIVRHELVHAALGQLGGAELPRWFQEGLAAIAAAEWSPSTDLAMFRASRAGIPLRDLAGGFPEDLADVEIAYAESASFVEYLFEHAGAHAVHQMIAACGRGVPFEQAFAQRIGPPEQIEAAWRDAARARYQWIPLVTGSGTLFALTALLCFGAYRHVRRMQGARIEEMDLLERADEAAERIRAAEEEAASPAVDVDDEEPLPSGKPTLH